MNGVVKFFNNIKGWGIVKNESGESFFIHHGDIADKRFYPDKSPDKFRTLKDGQGVTFEVEKKADAKYHTARNLRIL